MVEYSTSNSMGYGGYGPKTEESGTLSYVTKSVTGVASDVGSYLSSGISYLKGS